ncbi:hypothetical protein C8J57DRAFT_1309635 [Mycena rebaudengoi]|nr:hypothetical protein C8J57DRAFT_1309635 [Mycena rebaudengoi]
MLRQPDIARYLDQCNGSNVAIEEVISVYIVGKYMKGATTERILHKLKHLVIYLRVTGRSHILDAGSDAFKALTIEVALGGGRIGLLPPTSAVGREASNQLRRLASSSSRRFSQVRTDVEYGGPCPVHAFVASSQSLPLHAGETRTPWAEQYFIRRQRLGLLLPEEDAPDYVGASQRLTTLPLYESRGSESHRTRSVH